MTEQQHNSDKYFWTDDSHPMVTHTDAAFREAVYKARITLKSRMSEPRPNDSANAEQNSA